MQEMIRNGGTISNNDTLGAARQSPPRQVSNISSPDR